MLTFFSAFDVPVFWPILLFYWVMLFALTMKKQILHMVKYKYVPFSFGKQVSFISILLLHLWLLYDTNLNNKYFLLQRYDGKRATSTETAGLLPRDWSIWMISYFSFPVLEIVILIGFLLLGKKNRWSIHFCFQYIYIKINLCYLLLTWYLKVLKIKLSYPLFYLFVYQIYLLFSLFLLYLFLN